MRNRVPAVFAWVSVVFFLFADASAQTTTFTYQGSLKSAGVAATGSYDFEFALFDALSGGSQVGSTITALAVPVTGGAFSVPLNFGSQYPGADRYLEIRVRSAGGGAFTILVPRQQVSSSPYSVKSVSADTALNATQFGGLAPTDFVRNSTTQQTANLNISGNGTIGGDLTVAGSLSLNIVNAQTQYNLGGNRLISTPATDNLFVGIGAGTANTTSFFNSFFGKNAGAANTTGGYNSFFGSSSGLANSTGGDNSFFGTSSGQSNTTGNQNSFFGSQAGFSNTTGGNSFFGAYSGYLTTSGDSNSFFGAQTGQLNTTGFSNTFMGAYSGSSNTTGNTNSFFGRDAGFTNSTGSLNSFFGRSAGYLNTTGSNNSFFGVNAGQTNATGGFNSFFGDSSGFGNTNGASNSFFGNNSGKANSTGSDNAFFGSNAGASNTVSNNSFFGSGAGNTNTIGIGNAFFGYYAGGANVDGQRNSFFGHRSGLTNTAGSFNVFVGQDAGANNSTGSNNTAVGAISAGGCCNFVMTGSDNSFFGSGSGGQNTLGSANSFFGKSAGLTNTVGLDNSFFGFQAGGNNNGNGNSFIGKNAGFTNTTGTGNTTIGSGADVSSGNLTNATAVGSGAVVSASNSLVLGNNANVGIGVSAPPSKLTVAGIVETTTGGVKFPDGTIQTTASTGSGSAILNQSTLQTSASFNIDGTGAADILNAQTQYNLGGARVLRVLAPQFDLYVGDSAGVSDTSVFNTFVGRGTGPGNLIGNFNTFVGAAAGNGNLGSSNTAIGRFAGLGITTGSNNTLLGANSNVSSGTLSYATAIGSDAVVGTNNTIVIGRSGGQDAVQIPGNLMVSGTLGASAVNSATQFNLAGIRVLSAPLGFSSVFVGPGAGEAGGVSTFNTFVGVDAGRNTVSAGNSFFGNEAGYINNQGGQNSFFGRFAGRNIVDGTANTMIGRGAGGINLVGGASNTFLGAFSDATAAVTTLNNSTAVGFRSSVSQNNSLVLGSINGVNGSDADTNVGIGTTAPAARLHISGTGAIRARINSDSNAGVALTLNNQPGWSIASANGGQFLVFNDAIAQNAFSINSASNVVTINSLGAAGGTQLCRNANNEISTCSSSLRYKTNIGQFSKGMSFVKQLRPISFDWKDGGMKDVGFGAEDVAKIDPRFVTYNDKGEVEGVKYDRLSVAFVNAFKEQQQQIEAQQKEIAERKAVEQRLQSQIDELKKIVCSFQPNADGCKEK